MTGAEVLSLHQASMVDPLCSTCCCGFKGFETDSDVAAHQLNALKAAGYAVVELPAPDCEPFTARWMHASALGGWDCGALGRVTAWTNGYINFDGEALKPNFVRTVAAALLAAADAAEESE